MTAILQLSRELGERPEVVPLPGIHLRHYRGHEDIAIWLELRRRAFARQPLGVRDWSEADFEREFLQKHWWRAEAIWFAETQPALATPVATVGTVTLALRGVGVGAKPVVHWLAVLPSYRRCGVGRLLMHTLEATAWDKGARRIWLETHARWAEACQLYAALGYREADVAG